LDDAFLRQVRNDDFFGMELHLFNQIHVQKYPQKLKQLEPDTRPEIKDTADDSEILFPTPSPSFSICCWFRNPIPNQRLDV